MIFPEFSKWKNKINTNLYKDGTWVAEYKRIRIVAIKKK